MKLFKPGWIHHGFTNKSNKSHHVLYSIDLHPDGSRLATGGLGDNSSGLVVLWNMKPVRDAKFENDSSVPKKLFQSDSHLACVNCVRWSPSGQYLASAGDDRLIIIWCMTSSGNRSSTVFGQSELKFTEIWRCVTQLRGHTGDILDMNWSPDGIWLATASVDNTVRIWTANKWQEPAKLLQSGDGMIKGVTWDPVGRFIASQSEKAVVVWRTGDWAKEYKICKPFKEGAGHTQVLRLSWSPDGSNIVAPQAVNNGFPVAQVIMRSGWETTMDFVGHTKHVVCARYNPNVLKFFNEKEGAIVTALGSKDRSLSVWATSRNRPVVVVHDLFTGAVLDLTWSSCGMEIMCCSFDGTVAYLKFSEKEIGQAMSKEQIATIHQKRYGQSLLGDGSRPIGPLILETPEALVLQKERAKVQQDEDENGGQIRIQRVAGPSKQIETRTQDGKRRITPKFLGHLDEPDENSNSQFSQLTAQSCNQTNQKERQADTLTQPLSENKSPTVQASSDKTAITTTTEIKKSVEIKVSKPEEVISSMKSPKKHSSNKKGSTKTKNKHKHRDKRRESYKRDNTFLDDKESVDDSDVLPHKKRKRLVVRDDEEESKDVSQFPQSTQLNNSDLAPGVPGLKSGGDGLWLPCCNKVKPNGKCSLVCDIDLLVEATNDFTGEAGCQSYHRVVATRGGQKVWEVQCTHRINSMTAFNRFVCIADMKAKLHLLSSNGTRLSPPLILDSPVADIISSNNKLLAVTQAGTMILWSLEPLKQIIRESIQPLFSKSSSTYKGSLITKEGFPVIQSAAGSSYVFNLDLASWTELFDAEDSIKNLTVKSISRIPQGGSLASAQQFNKCQNGVTNLPPVSKSLQRKILQDFLECQMLNSQVMESQEEYRFWTKTRVRHLVEDGDEYRLRILCEDLLGPVHRSVKSSWRDNIIGIPKRELLKDLLPLFALNLQLQRLYVEIKEQLDSLT